MPFFNIKRSDNMKNIISGNMLKLIAIISMTIDHIGHIIIYPAFINACMINGVHISGDMIPYEAKKIYYLYILSRMIGRIAFPIFAFMIAEGALHTSDIRKYFSRLIIFAFISEIPYDLAMSGALFNMEIQNIFFTLAAGLGIIILIENTEKNKLRFFVYAVIFLLISFILKLSVGGIMLILSFYLLREDKKKLTAGIFFSTLLLSLGFSHLQWFSLLAYPIIFFYNGKRGKGGKYFFYAYYPAHLLFLYII